MLITITMEGTFMSTRTTVTQAEITAQRMSLHEAYAELRDMMQRREPEIVQDFVLADEHGSTSLSKLFGDHDDLIVVHNMGPACSYCTMWADSFSAQLAYLGGRTSFVLVNGEAPANQQKFAMKRGWTFPMASDADGSFTRAMGFLGEDGRAPGVSAFHRAADGTIERTGFDYFGPYDSYLGAWNFMALLKGGAGSWQPAFELAAQ